jgi:hypothetical protein
MQQQQPRVPGPPQSPKLARVPGPPHQRPHPPKGVLLQHPCPQGMPLLPCLLRKASLLMGGPRLWGVWEVWRGWGSWGELPTTSTIGGRQGRRKRMRMRWWWHPKSPRRTPSTLPSPPAGPAWSHHPPVGGTRVPPSVSKVDRETL